MNAASRRILLVVIDAQKAFAHRDGSLARACGLDDIQPGLQALPALRHAIAHPPPGVDVALVRSEYSPGQFTAGRLLHPLANVCVPEANVDCDWVDDVETGRAAWIVTKRQADAMHTPEFRAHLDRSVASGVDTIWFAGFQLTTCVKATAMSARTAYHSQGVRVAVLVRLCGVRASSCETVPGVASRFQQAVDELTACGVDVVHELPVLAPIGSSSQDLDDSV